MTQNISLDREAMAVAACDVAGLERPLSSDTPEDKRRYLYARPGSSGEKFTTEELSDKVRNSSVQCGVNWDPKSKNFGLRYVSASTPLPAELRPYTSVEAQSAWKVWREENKKMAEVVSDAAARITKGDPIEFSSDDELTQEKKPRRRARMGERD